MEQYLKEGYFGEGSMKPKVEACIDFVRETEGIAVIGNIKQGIRCGEAQRVHGDN